MWPGKFQLCASIFFHMTSTKKKFWRQKYFLMTSHINTDDAINQTFPNNLPKPQNSEDIMLECTFCEISERKISVDRMFFKFNVVPHTENDVEFFITNPYDKSVKHLLVVNKKNVKDPIQ